MTLLAKRYATALYMAAKGRGATDTVEQQLAGIHAGIADLSVKALLTSPDLAAAERERIVGKLVEGADELVRGLVAVLQQRRRLEVLFDIHPQFRAMVLTDRGEVEGVVETPRPLGDAEMQSITQLASKLSNLKVSLAQKVAPELLGGIRLRVGNILYDGSVQSSLEQLMQARV